MSFFSELKRRNVFRVGAAYAIVAWLFIQIADTLLPTFGAPDWIMPVLSVLIILGFLIALILAWAFELTPEGIKSTHQVDTENSATQHTGQKLNNLITIGLFVLLIFISVDQYIIEEQGAPFNETSLSSTLPVEVEATDTLAVENIPLEEKSIAVLPFDDFGAGGEDAYFADGLTEEILNTLTRTPDLLIASRTSSFQYKDQLVDIQQVADNLGVAYILEGSVRRSSTRLRVTAQLIRASDGFHLWSENYDRQPEDIIEVQEDIAFRIATALQTAMDPDALREMVQAGTRSITAYNAYLQGLAISSLEGVLSREGYELFESARMSDTGFAEAHAQAAGYWRRQMMPNLIRRNQAILENQTLDEMKALFLERILLAINNSSAPDQLRYRSSEAFVNLNFRTAFELGEQYTEVRPNDNLESSIVTGLLMAALAYRLGEEEKALSYVERISALSNTVQEAAISLNGYFYIQQFEKGRNYSRQIIDRFPVDDSTLYEAHRQLLWGGYIDEASTLLSRMSGSGDIPIDNIRIMQLRQYCADRDLENAGQIFEEIMVEDSPIASRWIALHMMNGRDEAVELLRPLDQENSLYSLSTFMVYPYFDIAQYPNLQTIMEREGVNLQYEPIPFACY